MMMKRIAVPVLTVALAAFALSSCMTVSLDATGVDAPVSMTGDIGRDYRVVEHFETPLRAWFIARFFTLRHPAVQREIQQQLRRHNGDAVINVRFVGSQNLRDYVAPEALGTITSLVMSQALDVDVLTSANVGLAMATTMTRRTYRLIGDVVRYSN